MIPEDDPQYAVAVGVAPTPAAQPALHRAVGIGGSLSQVAVLRASCPVIVVPATAAVPAVPGEEGGPR